nr:putative ribonuclease H-like domain-containing protein [Tanacetum cinerariifolium]
MDQDATHMMVASKVPMLKPGEFEIWRMRIEEYFQMMDYALWDRAKKKVKIVKKEKDSIQLTVEKLKNASKSLNKLIGRQIVDNYKKGLGYNAVLPPHTGLFMPPKPDLSYIGLEKFTSELAVDTLNAKTSKDVPKVVKNDNGAPITEDWKSDDEDESVSQPKIEKKTVKPSVAKIMKKLMEDMLPLEVTPKEKKSLAKLPDENHVLLRVPRKNNMYSVDLKNIIPKAGLTCLFAKATSDESRLWHRKLGHLNVKTMNKLVKRNLVRGLSSKFFENEQTCVACQKGKQHRASCKTKIKNSISLPLHMLRMDLFALIVVNSLMKKMYCLVVTDDYSRFTWVFFLSTNDETNGILKSFITRIENLVDHKVKVIRCDNETEFKNRDINQFCKMKGIIRQYSIARTPQQNRVAKKRNRTFIKAARTMLADSKLPTTFWAEAVNTTCYVQNRVLVTKPHNKTPYKLFYGKTQMLSFMRPFECPVTILNTIDHLGKFDGKDDEGFFVGYSLNSKAFRVFNSRTRIVKETLHIRKSSIELPDDLNMPELEDISIFKYSNEDVLGHIQEKGIDYDEVFAPVSRIKAIRLFLAYASFKDFVVYQMDVKSAFLYGKIEEEMSSMGELTFFLGLQVKQKKDDIFISQDKYVAEILKKFGFFEVKTASTPMETQKPLLKDKDEEEVDCKKQTMVANSITEAEYVAASSLWSRTLDLKSISRLWPSRSTDIAADKAVHKEGVTVWVISSSDDEALDKEDTSKQERIDEIDVDEEIAMVSTFDDMVQDEDIEDVTTAPTITVEFTKINVEVTQASKSKGVMIQEPKETTTKTTKIASLQQSHVQDKGKGKAKLIEEPVKLKKKDQILFDEEVARKLQEEIYEKERLVGERSRQEEEANSALIETWEDIQAKPRALKNKSFAEIKELFDKEMTRINNFIDFRTELVEVNTKKDEAEKAQESSSKRAGDELDQKRSKNQKVKDDKETEELKKCLESIPDDGDEVIIKAAPLSSKSPTIVDYKIYKEGKKNYFQNFRADGNSQMYLTFSKLLKNFDKEDLEVLWRLVKDRFVKTMPVDDMDSFLLQTLKTMFEHHFKDNVWKNQQGLTKVKNWKLFDSCGVHCVTMQNILYYILVEKMCLLTNHTLHQMFNNVKLQVDDECEIDYELLRLVKKQLKEEYITTAVGHLGKDQMLDKLALVWGKPRQPHLALKSVLKPLIKDCKTIELAVKSGILEAGAFGVSQSHNQALRGIAHKPQSMSDEDWIELDKKALATIQLFLTQEILREVIHETTTTGLWLKLESLYMTKSLTNKLQLKDRLYIFRMKPGTSVHNYLGEFNIILIDLVNLDVDIDDEDKVVLLVISLPASYKHFKKIMLYENRETLLFDDVKSALLSKQKYDDDVEPESGKGLVARGQSFDRGKGNNEKKLEKSAEVAIAIGDSDSDVYLAIATKKSKDELIVDSGCTFHMISYRSWFTTYESFNGDLKRNLISLSTLEANGCKYSGEGFMKIFKGALVLMKVIQSGGLYVLQGIVVYGTARVATSKASLDDSKLWPYRSGHMGEKCKKNLAKKGLIKVSCNLEFYERCVFGKQKRVSFSSGIHRTRDALDYIHYDLWGPSLVTSRGGKRYMLTIIDDFSRKYGIARHHTLVRIPQQNGVAKRMNRTIMEKVRCMLSHANLAKDFWVEAATTTTYLINHSPHRSLYGNIPEILCLGYGSGVKGYRVWSPDPKYHKIIHSRDITFNGDVIINSGKDFMPPHNVVAMEEEVESLHKNETWELVKLPKHKRVISCKWLFKVKDGIPGVESNRYKARYVVRGFYQRKELEQLDVKTTFFHGHLEEEIYVEQPKGCKVSGKEYHVCRLKKSLYGLKQSPRQWHNRFDSFMIGHGYDRYSYDECVYLRKFPDESFLYLDLGMEIQRDRKMGKLTLSQTDYISKVLKKFNMSSYKPVPTSLAPHFKLSSHECPKSEEDKEDMSRVPYSNVVGSLMYAMVCTRPYLAHAISVVSRYMHNLGYVDSDYAGDLDARKSLSSYIFSHCGSAIN